MPITMTITAENPEELFSTIKGAAKLINDAVPAAEPPATPVPVQTQQPPVGQTAPVPIATAPTAPVAVTAPLVPTQPSTAQPAATPAAKPAKTAVPTAAPQYTLEMIATAGASLVDTGKMDALCGLLAKYGIDSIVKLDPSQYGVFASELRALGAQI